MMLAVSRSTGLKIFGVMGMICLATLACAQDHSYKPGQPGAGHTLKHDEKWATDAALRRGMDNIRVAMMASRQGIDQWRLGTQDYQRLAGVVDKNVADIVKNCKLTPEADTAFHHIVLVDLTSGAQLMRTSPKIEVKRVGALGVLQTLRSYGEYFQHPGWMAEAR